MQVLDLRSWTWSKIDAKAGVESPLTRCAGHSLVCIVHKTLHNLLLFSICLLLTACTIPGILKIFSLQIPWGNKLLSIAGHTKDPSESIQGMIIIKIIMFLCIIILLGVDFISVYNLKHE